jgi:hypothetical protein
VTRAVVRLYHGEVALDCGASDPFGQPYLTGVRDAPKRVELLPWILTTALEHLTCARDLFPRATWMCELFSDAGLAFPRQAGLLRDLFGNPFNQPRFDPASLIGFYGLVKGMSEAIYDDQGPTEEGTLDPIRLAIYPGGRTRRCRLFWCCHP